MQEPYRKGSSESILTSSLAGDTARCFLKRRPEASVGGAIELRKARRSGCRLHSEEVECNTGATLITSGLSVLRSLRARARRETTCTRTGRSPARLGLGWVRKEK